MLNIKVFLRENYEIKSDIFVYNAQLVLNRSFLTFKIWTVILNMII